MNEKTTIKRENFMLVLSSPSGAGKTTLSRALLIANSDIELSISVTTRTKRNSEQNGRDYKYITVPEFNKLIDEDAFLEYAKVFENYYGTLKSNVERILNQNKDVLFDIDWQGMESISVTDKNRLVSIFILPPSMSELQRRLMNRETDDDNTIKYRMTKAHNEIKQAYKYDYIIINYDISESLKQINSILQAERLKRERFIDLESFTNLIIEN